MKSIADALDRDKPKILRTTTEEAALTQEELAPEFARMVGTLRLFARLVEDGSWTRAAIDPPCDNSIGPSHDVRRMLRPLGAVGVFGASNFPLAYGVCGGDTASALAAGCRVVVKEHPAHPLTGRLLARIAREAIERVGANPNNLSYVPHEDVRDLRVPNEIISHPGIRAIGFTGSKNAGIAIERTAQLRESPIPVFAEMGSINFVRITDEALKSRGKEIGDILADAILNRHGQQCTKPGLILVQKAATLGKPLVKAITERFRAAPARDMLAPWIRDAYRSQVSRFRRTKGFRLLAEGTPSRGPRAATPTLLMANWKQLASEAPLHNEAFGPATIILDIPSWDTIWLPHPESLAASIFCEPSDHAEMFGPAFMMDVIERHTGRLVFNGPPTGVRVAAGMVHGGPYPATNRPDTTAVGPFAIERWCRPVCFQNCPDTLLPPELQNANPRGILRLVNGQHTRDPIRP